MWLRLTPASASINNHPHLDAPLLPQRANEWNFVNGKQVHASKKPIFQAFQQDIKAERTSRTVHRASELTTADTLEHIKTRVMAPRTKQQARQNVLTEVQSLNMLKNSIKTAVSSISKGSILPADFFIPVVLHSLFKKSFRGRRFRGQDYCRPAFEDFETIQHRS